MKQVIGLAGRQSRYWQALMEYINGQKQFDIFVCTKEECLKEELDKRKPSFLFRERGFAEGVEFAGEEVLFLADQADKEEAGTEGIYRYQPAGQIYNEMLRHIYKDQAPAKERNGRIYGVYSPLGRSGKTSFALAYAKAHSFFYLGMEDYGLIGESENTMDDAIYLIRNRKEGILEEMFGLSEHWKNIRMIRSPVFFQDIMRMPLEDWRWFLDRLREGEVSVIIDFGSGCMTDMEILALFDRIYVPVLDGTVEQGKLALFRKRFLESCGAAERILRNIRVPQADWEDPVFLSRIANTPGGRGGAESTK